MGKRKARQPSPTVSWISESSPPSLKQEYTVIREQPQEAEIFRRGAEFMRLLMDKEDTQGNKNYKDELSRIDYLVTDFDSIPLGEAVSIHPLRSVLEKATICLGCPGDSESKVDTRDIEFYDAQHFEGVLLEDYDLDNGKLDRVLAWLAPAQQTLKRLWFSHDLQSNTNVINDMNARGLCFPHVHVIGFFPQVLQQNLGPVEEVQYHGATAAFFRSLHDVFPNLRDFTLGSNTALTALPLDIAPFLEKLRLIDCPQIRPSLLSEFIKRAPHLHTLSVEKEVLGAGHLKPVIITTTVAVQQFADQLRREPEIQWTSEPSFPESEFWQDVPSTSMGDFIIYHKGNDGQWHSEDDEDTWAPPSWDAHSRKVWSKRAKSHH